jgi:hypothetical protein
MVNRRKAVVHLCTLRKRFFGGKGCILRGVGRADARASGATGSRAARFVIARRGTQRTRQRAQKKEFLLL